MKFFKQTIKGSCNIIAIQHALSFFDRYPTFEEIKTQLPQHEFGNWLTEIGIYFESAGIKTRLMSNHEKFTSTNALFMKTLDDYSKKGSFEDRLPAEADIPKRNQYYKLIIF